jgi:hypothetical protein
VRIKEGQYGLPLLEKVLLYNAAYILGISPISDIFLRKLQIISYRVSAKK